MIAGHLPSVSTQASSISRRKLARIQSRKKRFGAPTTNVPPLPRDLVQRAVAMVETEKIEEVTAEQVLELSAEVYDPSHLSIVGIGSNEEQFAEVVPADCLLGLA